MLAAMEGKGEHGGDRKSSDIVSLENIGITKKQSSRWQMEAKLDEDVFAKPPRSVFVTYDAPLRRSKVRWDVTE